MCNEKQDKKIDTGYDYRFLDFRLDQLQEQITKGLTKLEQESQANNKEVIQILQTMQEGQNEQNKQLVELRQRQSNTEIQLKRLDAMREKIAEHSTDILNMERRLGIYQTVLIGVTISVVASAIILLVQLI